MRTATTTLVLCVGGLMALGLIMLYSSSMAKVGAHYLGLQGAWCGAAVVVSLVAALCDYRWLKKISVPLLVVAIAALVCVLIVGPKINGSRRWIPLGVFNFQPSELAKLALIVFLAWYGEKFQREIRTFWNGLCVPSLMAGVVLALIFLEPDRGTTILLGAVTGMMLLLAGVRWFYFIPPALAAMILMAYALISDPLRMRRIVSWLNPEDHRSGVGYQAWQAMIALGSGGLTGLGLGNGRQKLGFVPENHTDFILSVIGEEMGLVATLAVVCAFVTFVICGVYIAWHARDVFGLLLGSGITLLIGMQALINVGVATSTLPNKGLPLPFVSYGGSSLILMMLCIGVLISIARRGGAPVREDSEVEETDFRSTQFA